MGTATSEQEGYEEHFRRAGLPLLIEGREAAADIWNRAFPLLAFVFGAELGVGFNLEFNALETIAALSAMFGLVRAGLALWNWLHHRPLSAVPESVGGRALVALALVPCVPPLLAGEPMAALVVAAANLLLLGVVFLVLWFGVLQILVWAARHLVKQLRRSFGLVSRAIPMLLLFSVVLFVNTEMWQVFGRMSDASLIATIVLLVLCGAAFVRARIGREVDNLLARLDPDAPSLGCDAPPLNGAQRANVGLVLLISQALQVLVVSLSIAVFFVAFGLLAISDEVIATWLGSSGDELVSFDLFGVEIHLTAELLRVSGAIAAFSGLFFSIAVLTDSAYREEFLKEITDEMGDTFAKRVKYLALLKSGEGGIRTHEAG
jgi:hypothetical protein